ncbi:MULTISPECIES: flagellar export protein FliJ [Priestia]|uniref:flagellar export protein FliJ n=1 Tax=Priestia TaxID=2800373 RepID=UPI000E2F9421|nr:MULTISPECIES: flagellar export protein FliJ [Priestia]MCM3182790.1 flagellar biosynthesis chaperone FliJ [Priestia megaterium]MCM3192924.1 flagellar biosynthesis chaperone FliJ [Priestia megaterium]MCZ8492531.1 flagellar export protein FliJ [Priestia megaterium]MDG0057749.1 flagellar biosynthesis chaperone FliJ [Priestia sp. P5]UYV52067.1 flagellar export protein FliJ [Priestia megaterium]
MAYEFRLSKIMAIKSNEKDELLSQYNQSLQQFETAGEKLYKKLKEKETLIEQHTDKMKQGLSILEITSFQQFLTSAERVIERLQQEVMFARQQMNLKKLKLEEKNIEVKKYEKLKKRDYDSYITAEKQLEAKQMDELSLQQYMLHRN